jgi:hypothetical protein
MGNGWTPSRRDKQSKRIHDWRPWEQSTGPKTEAGKATVSRNADKGGWREQLRELRRILREQEQALEDFQNP